MANMFINASSSVQWKDNQYLLYAPVMFVILAVGFVGNILTIAVFSQKQYKSKSIAPFIINVAIADLFIVVFGYPVVITANLTGQKLVSGTARCSWSAFINGSIGIAAIAMLTEISVIMCYYITSQVSLDKIPTKYKLFLLSGPWLYGIVAMLPPMFGWSRFIPGAAGISCCPDWVSNDKETLTYNLVLMVMGFFLPITVTIISYAKIYR